MRSISRRFIAGWILVATIFASATPGTGAEPGSLTIKADQPGAKIAPMFYGLMTEEINHSYDGGLYAELIQNRIFKDGTWARRAYSPPDPTNPPHWSVAASGSAEGAITLDTSSPVNKTALTTSLRLDVKGRGGRIGVANHGFWGIPVQPNTTYRASLYARASENIKGPLTLTIESIDGSTVYASAEVSGVGSEWKKFTAFLTTKDLTPSTENRFVISAAADSAISLWFNLVSLFPPTYHDRPNGLRVDLMERMAALKPAFLRFPGGNYLEGPDYDNRFNWKTTIGPLEERPGHECPWNYRSSDGLGLLEFLEWCEDLKMEPVLAVYAGLHIDGGRRIITGEELKPHVQDALDEIEYVIGDTSTTWGARRGQDGHPAPFNLSYVEIGNEDNLNRGEPSYDDRFTMFYDAIKAKYPELQLIATTHVRSRKPDVFDDHLYTSPTNMLTRETARQDKRDRKGPKIFMGEWASQEGRPTPDLNSALGDAAFLGGLERNADAVVMQCYAPLLVNVNRGASQWGTNLIGYDGLKSFGSPSYYAQQMFSDNRGDRVLPVEYKAQSEDVPVVAQGPMPKGRVGVGTWITRAEFKDMKVTDSDKVVYSVNPATAASDWKTSTGDWNWDDDVLRQSSDEEDCRAIVGDPNWSDCTYILKARKISGNEGFLILFHAQDDENWLWWNIGGWGNTRTAIRKVEHGVGSELGEPQKVTIEPNKWYDIKIDLKGRQVRCYLDGKLVAERTDGPQPSTPPRLVATAVRDEATGKVILRTINPAADARQITINLAGMTSVSSRAEVEQLAGEPRDVNSVNEPTKLSPKKLTIENAAAKFDYDFPPHSLTIITFKPQ
jgi:alpha-L-arabinofuranosidase